MTNPPPPGGPEDAAHNPYLTGAEAAALLRTNRQTLRYWRHIGYGPPSFKAGRHVLYPRDGVQEWVLTLLGSSGGHG